jgi:hypothetical protein
VAGLLAFWSLIHIPDETVPAVFGQFRRVLRPGGLLLIGFHVGDGARLKPRGYGRHPMKVDCFAHLLSGVRPGYDKTPAQDQQDEDPGRTPHRARILPTAPRISPLSRFAPPALGANQ